MSVMSDESPCFYVCLCVCVCVCCGRRVWRDYMCPIHLNHVPRQVVFNVYSLCLDRNYEVRSVGYVLENV